MEPLASTKPAVPLGAKWWTMCCTQAKLALRGGGVPYCQRLSSVSRLPPQSETLKGGLARMKSALEVGVSVVVESVAVGDLSLNAADGEVHLGQPPSGVVGLLAVDGDVPPPARLRAGALALPTPPQGGSDCFVVV